MLRLAAHRNSGFTLIETLVVVVMAGILAAIAAPSFLTWSDRYKLDNALALLQGALQEAQQQAIRKSQTCSITIDTSAVTISESTTGSSCLPTGSRDLNNKGLSSGSSLGAGLAMATDSASTTPSITFTFKGTTSTANVFVLYKPNSTLPMKCLAISQGIGIVRIGHYSSTANPPTAVSAANCNTSAQ
jgi:prepilin-type N-terminal cleavage/methylation domain-containing protein